MGLNVDNEAAPPTGNPGKHPTEHLSPPLSRLTGPSIDSASTRLWESPAGRRAGIGVPIADREGI